MYKNLFLANTNAMCGLDCRRSSVTRDLETIQVDRDDVERDGVELNASARKSVTQ